MSTMDRISAVLTGGLGVDGSRVTPGARMNELGLDSMDLVDLQLELEDEFKLPIDFDADPAFDSVLTLSELAAAIDTKKARAA